jgi:hypothetical protein
MLRNIFEYFFFMSTRNFGEGRNVKVGEIIRSTLIHVGPVRVISVPTFDYVMHLHLLNT